MFRGDYIQPEPAQPTRPTAENIYRALYRQIEEGRHAGFQQFADRIEAIKGMRPPAGHIAGDAAPSIKEKFADLGISGGSLPDDVYRFFATQAFIGWEACAMAAQAPLMYKACATPARDAIRNGWTLSIRGIDDPQKQKAITDYIEVMDDKMQINTALQEYIIMGRIFGIRIALFNCGLTNDDLALPYNVDSVEPFSYSGVSQIDPMWTAPILDNDAAANPMSPHFYEPTWWTVGLDAKIHRTQLCIFRNGKLAKLLQPCYFYGGLPIPQLVIERLYAADRTANEAPQLAMTKRMTFWKTDVSSVLEDENRFAEQMQLWAKYADNYGIKMINGNGAEGDSVTRIETSLTDLDSVIMTQYQLVAAIAGLPATKLLGTTPKGFQSTGEYENKNYHEELESLQQNDMSPFLQRHYEILLRSHIAPKFGLDPDKNKVIFEWRSTDSPEADDIAKMNYYRATADNLLAGISAVSPDDIRKRLSDDPDSGYFGLTIQDEIAKAAAPSPLERAQAAIQKAAPKQPATPKQPDAEKSPDVEKQPEVQPVKN